MSIAFLITRPKISPTSLGGTPGHFLWDNSLQISFGAKISAMFSVATQCASLAMQGIVVGSNVAGCFSKSSGESSSFVSIELRYTMTSFVQSAAQMFWLAIKCVRESKVNGLQGKAAGCSGARWSGLRSETLGDFSYRTSCTVLFSFASVNYTILPLDSVMKI